MQQVVAVPSHEEWLSQTQPTPPNALPAQLLLGSFRGVLSAPDNGDAHEAIKMRDFGMVLGAGYIAAKGAVNGKNFAWQGKFASRADGSIRFCMSMVIFHSIKSNSGDDATHPRRPEPVQVARRIELRCEFCVNVVCPEDGLQASDSRSTVGPGLTGKWFEVDASADSDSEDNIFCCPATQSQTHGNVFLWPTPATQRTGGLLLFEFTTPVCGLEHTGTQPYWHGTGAFVLRAHQPACNLGLREGDIVHALNGQSLQSDLRSKDVSAAIRAASRPLRLVVWRDVGVPLLGAPRPHTDRAPKPSSEQPLPVPRPRAPSMATITSVSETRRKQMTEPCLGTSIDSVVHISLGLREDIMKEIVRKKQSLNGIKHRRIQRDISSL